MAVWRALGPASSWAAGRRQRPAGCRTTRAPRPIDCPGGSAGPWRATARNEQTESRSPSRRSVRRRTTARRRASTSRIRAPTWWAPRQASWVLATARASITRPPYRRPRPLCTVMGAPARREQSPSTERMSVADSVCPDRPRRPVPLRRGRHRQRVAGQGLQLADRQAVLDPAARS